MRIQKKNPKALHTAIDLLKENKVIIAPCDTIYGFLGIYPGTEEKIRNIKGREEKKPFLILASSVEEANKLCGYTIDEKLSRHWPGPVSLILPLPSGNTIGIRVPDGPFLQNILTGVGKPLFSTSVNRSGQAPLNDTEKIAAEFSRDVALIIDAGDILKGEASTIVDATGKPYKIIRRGKLKITLN